MSWSLRRSILVLVTTVLGSLLASLLAVLSSPSPAGAVDTPACGCTGPFVAPTTKSPAKAVPAVDEDDGTSPGGTYRLTSQGPNGAGTVTLTVTEIATGKTVLTVDTKAATEPHWGFSPDDASLAVYGRGFGEVWSLSSRSQVWRQDGVDAAYWFSPRGGFLVEQAVVSGIPRLVVVNTRSGAQRQLQGFTNLGFGKLDDRLAVWSATDAQLWDLTAGERLWDDATNNASALGFSPDGGYLEVQQVTSGNRDNLRILRTDDGTEAWSDTFVFATPPSGGSTPTGDAGGGFSPDGDSFVEAYRTAGGVSWQLVDLAAGTSRAARLITESSAFWRFSPCGDVIGLVQPSGISLLSTTTGQQVGSYSTTGAADVVLTATATSFVARVNGTDHVLAPNGAGAPCPTNTLVSLTLPPGDLRAGNVVGTVTLQKPAAGATPVALSSSGPDVTVPASVTVAAGATTATFTASALAVPTARTVTITAKLGSVTKTGTLRLVPPQLESVTGPESVVAHNDVRLLVSLDSPAPSGGLDVTATSSDPGLLDGDPVTIDGGDTSTDLLLTAGAVTTDTDVDVTVAVGGRSKKLTIRVEPLRIAEVVLPDAPVSSDTARLPVTVRLNGVAPAGGVVVDLTADLPDALAVPEHVTLADARSAVVDLTPRLVEAATTVEVTATTGTASASDTVELLPPVEVAEVTSDHDTAFAGLTRTLRVTLDRGWNTEVEGDTKDVAVSVSPSKAVGLVNGRVLSIASSGTAPQGAIRLKFGLVSAPTDVVVTVSLAGKSRSFTIRVSPPPTKTLFTRAGDGRGPLTPEPRNPLEVSLGGGPGLSGNNIRGLAVARDGAVYVRSGSSIARIDDEGIRRIADDGQSSDPEADTWGGQIDVGPDGTVYVAGGPRLTAVAPGGTVTTVPGSEGIGMLEDVAVDQAGNVYAADWTHHRVVRIAAGSAQATTVVNTEQVEGSSGDGGPAADAHIGRVYLDATSGGALYLGDLDHHVLRKVTPGGTISTIAGTGELPPPDKTYPTFERARDVAVDSPNPTALAGGAVAFADRFTVYTIDASGFLLQSAGNSIRGTEGDGYPADYPGVGLLSHVSQVAAVGSQLLIGDSEGARVRQVHHAFGVSDAWPFAGQAEDHDFGTVRLGRTSEPHRVTFTNDSDFPIPAGPTRFVDSDGDELTDFATEDDTCADHVLAPAESCSLSILFEPGSVGNVSAELRITGRGYDVGTVYGATPSPLSVSPEDVYLGDVVLGDTSETGTFVATNVSDQPVTLDSTWDLPTGAEIVTDECAGLTLPPDGQCTVGVRVTPKQLGWEPETMTLSGPGPVAGRSVPYVAVTLDLDVRCPSGTKPNGGTGTSGPRPTNCVPTGSTSPTPSDSPSSDPSTDPSETPSSTTSPSSTPSATTSSIPTATPTTSPTSTPTTPVRLKPQGVRARALVRTVARGKRVTVVGTISPAQQGKRVVLQQLVRGQWVTLRFGAKAHRDATNGRAGAQASFVLRFTPRQVGKIRYRVLSPATDVYAAGTSRTITVKVRRGR